VTNFVLATSLATTIGISIQDMQEVTSMKILNGIGQSLLFGLLITSGLSLLAFSQEKALSADELARSSDVIVVGKVASMKSNWTADRSRIVTTVTLQVDQSLKGATGGSTITLVTPGGEVDGVGELYTHSARFARQEDVVVFARRTPKGEFAVTAGQQGKMSIRKDPESGALTVGGGTTLSEFTRHILKAVKAGD
jgi:hypothetical protein